MKLERRRFLVAGSVAVASILLPMGGSLAAVQFSQSTEPPPNDGEINDFIWINADGKVVIGICQAEVGQGIYTGLAEVVANEMDADWQDVTVRFVTGRNAYRQVAGGEDLAQFVAASTSMTVFYPRMRQAGAQARDLFLRAGASYFGVRPEQCHTAKGQVIHSASDRRIGYGPLLGLVAKLKPNPNPPLKSLAEERAGMIGSKVGRIDTTAKVEGKAIFGIDVSVPGMAIGVPWMVPEITGRVVKIRNAETIAKLPGIIALVPTRHLSIPNMVGRDHDHSPNTVIVVAESYWQAKKAADLLDVECAHGEAAHLDSAGIEQANLAMLASDQLVTVVDRGGAATTISQAATQPHAVHEARYSTPYINQATMEPCNATAFWHPDHIETWGPFQGQDVVRLSLSKAFKLDSPDKVIVNNTLIGGSFGRKYIPDAVFHAVSASKAVGRPVKVIYPREIDIGHGYFRPPAVSHYRATLDADGYPQALWARYAGQSLFYQLHRPFVEKRGGWDETMVECLYDTEYVIPELLVQSGIVEQPISVSYMRSVGTFSSLFFLESFVSELAAKAGIDEYQYRRRLLRNVPEMVRVLDATADASGWNSPPPPNHYRGMAINIWVGRNNAFRTYVALVVEVKLEQGALSIVKATCGVDCGQAVNPNLVKSVIEGGIGFGITMAFKSQLHFKDGAVVELNYNTYPLAKIRAMPDTEVVVLDSDRPPQGAGEVSTGVVAPALASALHKATGQYFRHIPFPESMQPDQV